MDTGLTNDTVYYYGVFSYNEDGVASPGAFTNATPVAGTPLSQLAEGTLIKILENGSPVEFYLAKHNYESGLNGAGRELVVRKDCYDEGTYSSKAGQSYPECALNAWCSNTYLGVFSEYLQSKIGNTTFPVVGAAGQLVYTAPVFILSLAEFGWPDYPEAPTEGASLPIASVLLPQWPEGKTQWTRTIADNNYDSAWIINVGVPGMTNTHPTQTTRTGNNWWRRPCFTLPSALQVDENLNIMPGSVSA